jgi:hypothetical protein
MVNIPDRYKDKTRLIGAVIYFLTAIALLIVIIGWSWRSDYFYDQPLHGFENWRRLIWCFMWCFLGFSVIAYRSSLNPHDNKAWPSYATSYLIILIHIALITFSILQAFQGTHNYVFYFLSSPICFSMSYSIDDVIKEKLKILAGIFRK